MTLSPYPTLRDLIRECAARNGWHTQRRIAVSCGIEESALSRFLDGRQDLGAVATFEIFRAVSVPVEQYPLAFDLLRRAQAEARRLREAREAQEEARQLREARQAREAEARQAAPESAALPAATPVPPLPPAAAAPAMLYRSVFLPESPEPRDVAALAQTYGLTLGTDAPTVMVTELFATEHFTGPEIAAFFGREEIG